MTEREGRPETIAPLRISFAGSAPDRFCGAGWSHPERHARWTTGVESTLVLGPWPFTDDALLHIEIAPLVHPQKLPAQRLDILANGFPAGRFTVAEPMPRIVSCVLPAAAFAGKAGLTLTFRHPDAASPASFAADGVGDRRPLALFFHGLEIAPITPEKAARWRAVEAAMKVPLASSHETAPADPEGDRALALRFESLGSDCEFGFVQRFLGAEPLSLLRFTGMRVTHATRALHDRFGDLAGEATFRVEANRFDEYIGIDDAYAMEYHSERFVHQIEATALKRSESTRLRFLARKLLEDIEEGGKILVVRDKHGLALDLLLKLVDAVQAIGPATLLWVDVARDGHPAGSVDVVAPGLMTGYVDRWAHLIEGPQTVSLPSWRQVLHNAHLLAPRARITDASPGV